MTTLALWILTAAVLIGVFLVLRFADWATRSFRRARDIHGVLAALGLALLVAGLVLGGGNATPDRYGVAFFAPAAAGLAFLALLIGLALAFLINPSRAGIGVLIGAHATVAVTAYVLLLAYVLLG